MIRLIITMTILAGMAACASSAPPAAVPGADSVATANVSNEAVAGSEATVSSSDDTSVIEALEGPSVAMTALPATEATDEVVCHREKRTGSNMTKKVCRLRSEMDRTREETQKALRRMNNQSSTGGLSD